MTCDCWLCKTYGDGECVKYGTADCPCDICDVYGGGTCAEDDDDDLDFDPQEI